MTRRERRQKIREVLNSITFERDLTDLVQDSSQQVITVLLSFISNPNDLLRWRAVIALGAVVIAAAEHDLEPGRRIIRRLMWSLNDESGSIGWGAPEAMAEIMAGNKQLASEYLPILISYIGEESNFLEEIRLQGGVLWGLGRLALLHRDLIRGAVSHVTPYLKSSDGQCRALAAWVLGLVGVKDVREELKTLAGDEEPVTLWHDGALVRTSIGAVASDALATIDQSSPMC